MIPARELRNDIERRILFLHHPIHQHSDCNGRVDMASGNTSNAVCHRDHGWPECECNQDHVPVGDDRGSATDKSKGHRTECFGLYF